MIVMKDDVSHSVGAKTAGLASYILIAKIVSMVIAGIALIVVARILGPQVYGVYTIAIAVAGMFSMASDFGVGTAFSKFIAEYKSAKRMDRIDTLVSNGLFASLVLGIVLTVAAFALSGILSSIVLHSTAYAYVLQLASFMVVTLMIAVALNSALVGFGEGRHIVLMMAAQVVVQAVASIALAMSGFGAVAPILGLILGCTTQIVYSLYVIFAVNRVRLVMPTLGAIKDIFKFSMPIAATNALGVMVSSLSFIVLGAFATTVIVGNVGIASKVGTFISAFAESIGASLLPAFAVTLATKRSRGGLSRLYNYAVHVSLMIAVPVVLSVALLSRQFIFTIFSGEYSLAPLYVAIVSLGVIINIVSLYTSTLLIGGNKVRELLKNYLALTAVQLISMFVLVPNFKGVGMVVLMFIVTPVASVLLFARELGIALKVKLDLDKPLRIMLAGVISLMVFVPVMIAFDAQYIALLVGIAIEQLIVYPPVLAMVGGVARDDLDVLKRITGHIPILGMVIALLADYSARFART